MKDASYSGRVPQRSSPQSERVRGSLEREVGELFGALAFAGPRSDAKATIALMRAGTHVQTLREDDDVTDDHEAAFHDGHAERILAAVATREG